MLYEHRFVNEPAYDKKKKISSRFWSKLTGGQIYPSKLISFAPQLGLKPLAQQEKAMVMHQATSTSMHKILQNDRNNECN